MILEEMIYKQNLLGYFKDKLTDKGHNFKTLSSVNSKLNLLNELITIENANMLNALLRKTNFRLFKSIEKGQENLLNILKYPEDWTLSTIDDNRNAWLNDDSLIFQTEKHTLVFTRGKANGFHYINNRWQ